MQPACQGLTTSEAKIREAVINTYSTNDGDRESVANNLERIGQRTGDAPDIDPAMIASVRDAVSRGRYCVERGRIAEKLIHLDTALRRPLQQRRD